MSSAMISAPLVNRLAQSMSADLPEGYYRSKLFIAPYATNPLIAAAGPIFSLLERLSLSQSLPPVEQIRENIEHEFYSFLSRLHASEYVEDSIRIARYIMSAAIDELIGKSYLRLSGEGVEFKAFSPSSAQGVSPEQGFFEVIHYIKARPTQYLDLIELAYYCLILGFEGELHFKADGRQVLDNLIEELFLIIQKHRVHKPCRLLSESGVKRTPTNKKTKTDRLLTFACALFIVVAGFSLAHYFLEKKANDILSSHFLGAGE